MQWAELKTRQLASISRETVCVLPWGAIEQHGPHPSVATNSGVWGMPSFALTEKGRAIFNIVVPAIRDLLAAYWPAAPDVSGDSSTAAGKAARKAGSSENRIPRRASR